MNIRKAPTYLSQRDNMNLDGSPNRFNQCMISSFTMFLNWCADHYKFAKFDERAYLATIQNWIDNTKADDTRFDWDAHVNCINTILEGQGIKEKLRIMKLADAKPKVYESLNKDIPVPMSINISAFYNGAKGHIVLCIGWNEAGLFFLDPFGNAKGRYKEANGENVFYSQAELQLMIDADRRCAILE